MTDRLHRLLDVLDRAGPEPVAQLAARELPVTTEERQQLVTLRQALGGPVWSDEWLTAVLVPHPDRLSPEQEAVIPAYAGPDPAMHARTRCWYPWVRWAGEAAWLTQTAGLVVLSTTLPLAAHPSPVTALSPLQTVAVLGLLVGTAVGFAALSATAWLNKGRPYAKDAWEEAYVHAHPAVQAYLAKRPAGLPLLRAETQVLHRLLPSYPALERSAAWFNGGLLVTAFSILGAMATLTFGLSALAATGAVLGLGAGIALMHQGVQRKQTAIAAWLTSQHRPLPSAPLRLWRAFFQRK